MIHEDIFRFMIIIASILTGIVLSGVMFWCIKELVMDVVSFVREVYSFRED